MTLYILLDRFNLFHGGGLFIIFIIRFILRHLFKLFAKRIHKVPLYEAGIEWGDFKKPSRLWIIWCKFIWYLEKHNNVYTFIEWLSIIILFFSIMLHNFILLFIAIGMDVVLLFVEYYINHHIISRAVAKGKIDVNRNPKGNII